MKCIHHLLLVMAALLLFSCGGNSPSAPAPNPNPIKKGSLKIEVLGLINGLKADITVTGPNNYSQHYDSSVSISGIPLGEYIIMAKAVIDSLGDTISVNPDSQVVTIKENKTSTAQVYYQSISFGSLQITPSGLPAGESYDIVITSVNDPSLSWHITKAALLDSLKPGPYRIVADEIVITGGETYKPDALVQIFNVVQGALSRLSIIFSPKYGSLSVLIIGMPSNADADVEISGYGNVYHNLFQSGLIDSLEAGKYTVIANEVTLSSGTAYKATPDSQVVTVVGGEVAFANIDYKAKFGVLFIEITGLPSGVDPEVTISGPSLVNENAIAGNWYDSLDPGDYSIVADSVIAGDGTVYVPDIDSQVVGVVAGDSSFALVVYKENIGDLSVLIIGLPSGEEADVTVSGQNYPSRLLTHTELLNSLEPGKYSIVARDVTMNNGMAYTPDPDSQTVTVVAGDTVLSTVDYKPKHGVMYISVTGLPQGTAGDVIINGKNFPDLPVMDGDWVDSLMPGDYSIIAQEVTATDGTVYKPDLDSQIVAVVAGDSSFALVVYKEKFGLLTINVSGLPVGIDAQIIVKNQDGSNQWTIKGTDVLDSLIADDYTVLASEVIDKNGDTLKPEPDSQIVVVVSGDTANVNIKYKGGLSIRLLNGRTPAGIESGVRVEYYTIDSNFIDETFDKQSFAPPNTYTVEGCAITGPEEPDISTSTQISGSYGSGSAQTSFTYDDGARQLVIRQESQATSSPVTGYKHTGTVSYGQVWLNWTNPNALPPITLEIDNPKGDSILIDFDWTYSASASTDYPNVNYPLYYWEETFEYVINPNPCLYAGGGVVEALFWKNPGTDPGLSATGSGSKTIVITGTYTTIGFKTKTNSLANSYSKQQPPETYYSNVATQSEITITIRVVK